MRIESKQIRDILEDLKISYNWPNYRETSYEIASLFEPINNGFYFYIGSLNFNFELADSLILVSSNTVVNSKKNDFIYLNHKNPQEIFYKILSYLHKRTSNGHVSKTSVISKTAFLDASVQVDDFCVIEDRVVLEKGVIIGSHCRIHANTVVKENSIVESGSVIGAQGVAWVWDDSQKTKIVQPQLGGVLINKNCFIGAGAIIVRGSLNENTVIGENTLLAPGVRLGHGTKVGSFVHFANNVVTGGNVEIGDYSFIGSSATLLPKVKVHEKTIVGAGSLVVKNTAKSGLTLVGLPAKETTTKEAPKGMPKPKD
ncbi:hypothetical protein ACFSQP_10980 [Bizionia sediminis]|uniref:UDP-3-O-(3-hydroxymyristoyl)glucosamine N-acyltransferase n=1 Tax=Bizionia sediminis TaxID=1737064 RepID=A0ABW5KTP6_9FLAO